MTFPFNQLIKNNQLIFDEIGTVYPDFCYGYLYTLSQKTSLLLADVARSVPSSSIGLEDYYLTGICPKPNFMDLQKNFGVGW